MSEKQNNILPILRRRYVHSWFADRPFFRFSCHSPRAQCSVLISITFGSQTQIGFLSPSLLPVRTGQKAAVGGGWRWWSSRKGKRMESDERNGDGKAEFNFSRSRFSVSARIFIPFRATTQIPLFHFATLFAENSWGYLILTARNFLPFLLFPLPPPPPPLLPQLSRFRFVIFYFLQTRCG